MKILIQILAFVFAITLNMNIAHADDYGMVKHAKKIAKTAADDAALRAAAKIGYEKSKNKKKGAGAIR